MAKKDDGRDSTGNECLWIGDVTGKVFTRGDYPFKIRIKNYCISSRRLHEKKIY